MQFEIRILKSEVQIRMAAKKTQEQNSKQSVIMKISQQNSKWPT